MNNKVAITGATGFVGNWLQRHFQLNGVSYQVFDGNLLEPGAVALFLEKHPVETIIHLAGAFAGEMETLVQKNVLTTQRLLEAGKERGLKKIIYTSTGAVYGEPMGTVSLETDELRPNTLYGLSKKMAEDTVYFYHRSDGIQFTILRFPNVYGPGNNKGVLYQFLKAIRQHGKIRIAGDGLQSRNFLHVADACKAIECAVNYPQSDTFNISNPAKLTINEIVAKLKKYYQFDIEYVPQDNFLKDLLLDTSKAEQLLGFAAAITGIDEYIAEQPAAAGSAN